MIKVTMPGAGTIEVPLRADGNGPLPLPSNYRAPGEEQSTPVDDGWCCGDAKIRAQATLRLIIANNISDVDAIEAIRDLIDCAGKAFATSIAEDAVPF